MGIDLGLKDLATISIGNASGRESARYFLNWQGLFRQKFDTIQGKFVPLDGSLSVPNGANIPRHLDHLSQEDRNLRQLITCLEKSRRINTLYYKKLNDRLEFVWQKRHHLYEQIINQLCHRIFQIAQYYHVGQIKLEDLGWSHPRGKKVIGNWLAQKQQQWFFSQIEKKIEEMGKRAGIKVDKVNARWTSQICAVHCGDLDVNFSPETTEADIHSGMGKRTGKTFRCNHSIPDRKSVV